MTIALHIGDCRAVLATLPDASVHCVVTSPPYWGLRDYGTATWQGGDAACSHSPSKEWIVSQINGNSGLNGGFDNQAASAARRWYVDGACRDCGAIRIDAQLGLEPDFNAYVASMVAVFREVRRVLRDDGTLWLNLGSSYAGGGRRGDGSYAAERPGWHDIPPNQSLGDVPAYGNDGKGLPNSSAADRACPGCGGELTACSLNRHDRSVRTDRQNGLAQRQRGQTSRGNEPQDCASIARDASVPDAPQSTIVSLPENVRDACDRAVEALACRSEQPTFFDDGHQSVHSSVYTSDIASSGRPSIGRKSDMAFVCTACGYSTRMYPKFKPKDMIPIPWMVAMALQADGWFLRQDLIWSKPNPMPESVTDRCTKAHEYLFLLSKRERYFYDAEAIAEPVSPNTNPRISQDLANQIGTHRANGGAKTNGPLKAVVKGSTRKLAEAGSGIKNNDSFTDAVCLLTEKRNKRSVWEVTTQPFSEAHFATFPPALIEPCIKAGCPIGGTVLDPFGGAGTTGLVADRLQRNAVLIELNPAYAAMSSNRIKDDAPLFAEVAQP